MTSLEKLLSISSASLADARPVRDTWWRSKLPAGLLSEVGQMLSLKNGFVAFESALLTFPTRDSGAYWGWGHWNEARGWRRHYTGVLDSSSDVCFAQDLFGGQFLFSDDGIRKLDPETGDVSFFSNCLEGWAGRILMNYAEETGWPLAREWQHVNGLLPECHCLLPLQPFVLGGQYEVGNLVAVEARRAMENWGRLHLALKGVADGESVTLREWLS